MWGKSLKKIRSQACLPESGIFFYAPTHDVAPSAVTIAVATDAMICMINLMVSFLLIILMFRSASPLGSAKNVQFLM